MLNDLLERAHTDDRYIVLHIDPQQTQGVLNELLEPLRSPDIDAELPAVGGAFPHTEFLGFIGIVKDTVEFAYFVAQRIIEWRKKKQEKGEPTGTRLECVGLPLLNLDDCTDEDIRYYIVVQRKHNETRITAQLVQKRRWHLTDKQVGLLVGAGLMLVTCGPLALRLLGRGAERRSTR